MHTVCVIRYVNLWDIFDTINFANYSIVLKDHSKKETLEKQEITRLDEENSFKESSWVKIYKNYEGEFKEAFKGSMQKESFKKKLLSECDTNKTPLQTFDDLKEKAKTIFGKAPESIDYLKDIEFGRINSIEIEEIWDNKIIGKSDVDISGLIQKLNLNDWVNQGRSFIQIDDICPFCQQATITEDFKKQLEDYFDESFTASIKKISEFNDHYSRLSDNLINELTQIETKGKTNIETKLDVEKFSAF